MVDKAFISLSDKGLSKELCPQVLDQEHLLSAGEPQAVLQPPPHHRKILLALLASQLSLPHAYQSTLGSVGVEATR